MFSPSMLRRSVMRACLPLVGKPFAPLQKRSLHEIPNLHHGSQFETDGIPGLFSPTAFKIAWTDYQTNLVAKLNVLIEGQELEEKTAVEIAILTSRQANLAAIFNYASQAHNNHFFFEALSPAETEMPDRLLQYIPDTFTSVDAMRAELLATAEAMFGAGWVWLVLDVNKRFRILCTYNAGTPYGLAHRRQDTDMNTSQTLGSTDYTAAVTKATRPRGTQDFIPLVNINCWEHAWLTDFGIAGKSEYLEIWWKRVNWDKVLTRLGSAASRPVTPMYR